MKRLFVLFFAAAALLGGCKNTGTPKGVASPSTGEELSVGDNDEGGFYDDYTWDAVDLQDHISLMYDRMDYAFTLVGKSDDELVFRLEPKWEEAEDAFALIRFEMADRTIDTDSDAWQETLQDALDPLITALEEDGDFEMDGRFSPWYELDTDFGEYIRYMGTRVAADKYVQGAFAARGLKQGRALVQAEASDEEALMILLDLFETVSFDF